MNRPFTVIFLLLLIAVAGAALHHHLKGSWTPWDDKILPSATEKEKEQDLLAPLQSLVSDIFQPIGGTMEITKGDVTAWYQAYESSEYHQPGQAKKARARTLCRDLIRALKERDAVLAEKERVEKMTFRQLRPNEKKAARSKAQFLESLDRRWGEYVRQFQPRCQRDVRALQAS